MNTNSKLQAYEVKQKIEVKKYIKTYNITCCQCILSNVWNNK